MAERSKKFGELGGDTEGGGMTTQTQRLGGVRVRVVRHHRPECEGRMVSAGWGSGWYFTGNRVWGDRVGRNVAGGHQEWLVMGCNFGGKCKAEARVNVMDVVDWLTASGRLPMTTKAEGR